AATTFREEGAHFVSLSGAPLARLDRGERPTVLQRLLDMIAKTMEPVYGFRSLLHFKAKFQPVYQPLYLAYPDPAAIGSIATAISRAYLPHLTTRQALRLLTKLLRPHTNHDPGAAARKQARPIRDDTVVSGRVTGRETAASRQTWPSGPFPGYTELEPLASGGFGDAVLARHDAPGTLRRSST